MDSVAIYFHTNVIKYTFEVKHVLLRLAKNNFVCMSAAISRLNHYTDLTDRPTR